MSNISENARPLIGPISRRGFLGGALIAASLPIIAACAPGAPTGGGASSAPITFWDMAWGSPAYSDEGARLTGAFVPASDMAKVKYQVVQWADSYQAFASAIASKTGPSIGTGAAFQPFQFAEQGAIHYADAALEKLRSSGAADDFLPGLIDTQRTKDGYVAIPWCLDTRVLWCNSALLEKAGVEMPTDWQSFADAGRALKKIGVSGFGTGAGSGNGIGKQSIHSFIINNGGGFFDVDGNPDAITERNIETLEFFRELSRDGIMSPASASYSQADLSDAWKSGGVGMGIHVPDLKAAIGSDSSDLIVMSPLVGPHGDKGTVTYVNSIAMYSGSSSVESAEAFVLWYLDNMATYWKNGLVQVLPVRQSIIDTPEFQANAGMLKSATEWQPIAQTFATKSDHSFGALAAFNAGQAFATFTQQVILGSENPKKILEELQVGMESTM